MVPRRSVRALIILFMLALVCASCGPRVDVKQAVEITETSGGWYDAGIVDGKNRIVPRVSFRLRKKQDVELRGVSLNVVFRHPPAAGTDVEQDFSEVFVQNAGFNEGNQTALLTVLGTEGYTGDPPQTRAEILKHSQFRDVRARIYAKHSSAQWVDLGTIDVPRQLITRQ
jgi:hypothetical protein